MENASKALLMAGGTLIAILIMSLIVYVFTTSTRMAEAQDEKISKQQTAEFNKQYEAYDKSRMYGTDIISVVNKAIDYNRRLDVEDEEYRINIVLDLKQDFDRTTQTITQKADGSIDYGRVIVKAEGTLKVGTYQLFERAGTTKMNTTILNFFRQSSTDIREDEKDGTKIITTYEYSAISSFKSSIFQCTNIEYSKITGRVSSMTFSQV